MSVLENRAIVIQSNCQRYFKQSESRLSDNNTLDNYFGDYLKLIVEDSSIENTCWVKGPHEYEQNLILARQDLESFINKMLSCFENKEIYTSLFNEFINNCLEMITTDWDNFKEYEKQRYFCNNETFIINQMELFPIIDEKNCKKLQEGKLNYFEFLRVWKNINDA